MRCYYEQQLDKVLKDHDPTYPIVVQVRTSTGSTNYLDLNKQSIPVLIAFLQSQLKKEGDKMKRYFYKPLNIGERVHIAKGADLHGIACGDDVQLNDGQQLTLLTREERAEGETFPNGVTGVHFVYVATTDGGERVLIFDDEISESEATNWDEVSK